MKNLDLIKGIDSKENFNWRITKNGKDVVSSFTSFLTMGAFAISLFLSTIAVA